MYAIELKNLWKKYRIGQPRTLTHAIPLFFSDRYQKEFLALKGINLQVKEGEKIGIIGPNGSGKSTLLQTIAGITTPTKGTVIVNGKVTALLGLGAGFHPELTGKDNIYLSGSILGMEAREITKRFDEIVEFSGIKKFLDTPVKHYSSGMFIRLAFSVSIHLEWDILLLDEVLAVGDAEFKQKSLSKMKEFFNSEKTIILVSHNLETIGQVCQKGIVLKSGRMAEIDKIDKIIAYYKNFQNEVGHV
ncbi:MAG: ABC transporter, ATP-binding protein [Candidatus Curtissbacteria bacterium GW2011_GWC2_38_9]|uniref:ABC transporter domain-containing protein n=3 Tax=Candidatus Curtissiibacteriota TaxID=1752717 RepID=A0A1F5HPW9_9BACT|nr:MAG: ABC transporter, ATP-binding protein [Candidatus Curtissbacteria bacterium GW2011_GWC2_38_9]KKS04452.1 MAG: ABC transporter, ATP-binding protein [Candidatus Curtissbacteria bacterium GW2011_GWA2_41_24]OGD89688.1 MAG: hypothetical protein A2Z54_01130 [Candidatus Curtissbacteria bacterium RIFCSPHIGHO2_02_39_8]OGE06113.1 MAG: hypothetical protein A2W70_05205 [Candidatus Curtissbacteria bacterium RIFCSPLOWO2_02_41_11]